MQQGSADHRLVPIMHLRWTLGCSHVHAIAVLTQHMCMHGHGVVGVSSGNQRQQV